MFAGLREAKPAEQLCVVGATVTIGAARKSTQTNVCESTWDLSALATSLETAYAAEGHVEYWSAECDSVLTRLNRLEHQLSDRYAEPFLLGVGGSGIAIRLTDRLLSQQFVALKFPRPVPGRADLLGSLMDKEIGHLAKLRHSAVVRLHTSGTLGNKAESCGRFPYYVMDFISGNKSITYFESQQVDDLSFIQIVQKTATAIAYLHDNGVAHLDIKPDNILITADGEPVLTDLGTAKALDDLAGQTIVACTYAYADPELLKTLDKDPSDKNRARGNVRRRDIDRKWDLFSFGKTLLHWLGFDPLDKQGKETFRTLHLQPYTRKYILLLAARLLHGDIDTWLEDRIGLDRRLLKQLSYADATRVLLDLRKLSGDYSIVDAVPELNVFYPRTLQVASDGPIPFSQRVAALVQHSSVQRLATISQLGLVRLVYPTARHSRLEHSLGTFHNACRFILSLYYDPLSPLFRQIVDASDIRATIVAALLHDVGHFPLAHDLEEIDHHLFSHKSLGTAVLRGVRDTKRPGARKLPLEPFTQALRDWEGVTVERLIEILDAESNAYDRPIKDRILHSIIDGPLDADKLDYMRRDSHTLGLPFGEAIDLDRIYRSLTVILDRKGTKGYVAAVGVHEKGKVAAELSIICRYAMFSQAYWQHTVRASKAMLTRALTKLLSVDADKDERRRYRFQSDFERFVLPLSSLIDTTVQSNTTSAATLLSTPNSDAEVHSLSCFAIPGSSLEATDAVVLAYFRSRLLKLGVPESELLDDILTRSLYPRLFVFSKERSEKDWDIFMNRWTALTPKQRVRVYSDVEAQLLTLVNERSKERPDSDIFSEEHVSVLQKRVENHKPVLLIDIPGDRPGSDVPLYYVIEAQRRALRRDDRVIGEVYPSDVWKDFGEGLRSRAGKVRVFCHPTVVDILEAAIDRGDFVSMFESQTRN